MSVPPTYSHPPAYASRAPHRPNSGTQETSCSQGMAEAVLHFQQSDPNANNHPTRSMLFHTGLSSVQWVGVMCSRGEIVPYVRPLLMLLSTPLKTLRLPPYSKQVWEYTYRVGPK